VKKTFTTAVPGPLLVASTCAFSLLVFVLLEAWALEWEKVQDEYRESVPEFEPGERSLPLVDVALTTPDGSEYCVTCHLASAGYPAVDGSPVFARHSDVHHEPIDMGCVICHKGDPQALDRHQENTFGLDLPLPGDLAWVSCLHCHDPSRSPAALAEYPAVGTALARIDRALRDSGCIGCHEISRRGGLLGPSLRTLGQLVLSDPSSLYANTFERVRDQIADLQGNPDRMLMPVFELDGQDLDPLVAWLSMNGYIVGANRDAWVFGEPASFADGEQLYTAFCSGCHEADGGGRELGLLPGPIPTLGSRLFATYAARDYLISIICEGRPGTLMEGFSKGGCAESALDKEAILSASEVDKLADYLLDRGSWCDDEAYGIAAAASCEVCHFERNEYHEALSDTERVDLFREHPWRFDLERFMADEGFSMPDCVGEQQHRGEELHDTVCSHCHEQARADAAPASAPDLWGFAERPEFDDSFFLMNVIVGRGDAPPSKWRHQGILNYEYDMRDLVCLMQHLREVPK
jgi:cytochrome c2